MFSSNIDFIETTKCGCYVQVKVALFWGRSTRSDKMPTSVNFFYNVQTNIST